MFIGKNRGVVKEAVKEAVKEVVKEAVKGRLSYLSRVHNNTLK